MVEKGFLPKPVYGYPNIEEIFSDLIDENFEYGGNQKNTQLVPKTDGKKNSESFKKKDGSFLKDLTEQQYSKHSDHVVKRFSHDKNRGEIPDTLKTKKFAQRLLPKV